MNDRQRPYGADDAFSQQAKTAFDDSVERLDAATRSRLNQNRQRALEHAARGRARFVQPWVPAAGVAGAAAIVVAVWTVNRPPLQAPLPTPVVDMEIILELDDFEMLENLEFYSWVDLDDELDRV